MLSGRKPNLSEGRGQGRRNDGSGLAVEGHTNCQAPTLASGAKKRLAGQLLIPPVLALFCMSVAIYLSGLSPTKIA